MIDTDLEFLLQQTNREKLTQQQLTDTAEFMRQAFRDQLTDIFHPEFGSAWDRPDGECYKAYMQGKRDLMQELMQKPPQGMEKFTVSRARGTAFGYAVPDDRPVTIWVHARGHCAGPNCVIHNPSDHPLKDAPLLWDDTIKFMFRLCEHDYDHIDPDAAAYEALVGHTVPKCDCECGCCRVS